MNGSWSEETRYLVNRIDKIQEDLTELRATMAENHGELKGELKGLKGKVAIVASTITVFLSSILTAVLKKLHIG